MAVCCDMEPGSDAVVVGQVGKGIALRRASRLRDEDFELIGVAVGAIVGTRRGT